MLSAGALLKREDGKRIDGFDRVYRFNTAPTRGFERHVGARTTHRAVHFWAGKNDTEGPSPAELFATSWKTALLG